MFLYKFLLLICRFSFMFQNCYQSVTLQIFFKGRRQLCEGSQETSLKIHKATHQKCKQEPFGNWWRIWSIISSNKVATVIKVQLRHYWFLSGEFTLIDTEHFHNWPTLSIHFSLAIVSKSVLDKLLNLATSIFGDDSENRFNLFFGSFSTVNLCRELWQINSQ